MTQYNGYMRSRFEPFAIKQVRQNEPYRADIETQLVNNTNASWFQCSPNRKSWAWPDPDSAPGAVIDTYNTSSNINVCPLLASPPRMIFYPPWYVGDAVVGLKITCIVAMHSGATRRPIVMKSFAREMTGTSSTEYGEGDHVVLQGAWAPWGVGRWRTPASANAATNWVAQSFTQNMIFTSLPAGRDLKIRFTATETGPVDTFSGALSASGKVHVKFAALMFADIMAKPESGF